MRQTCLLLILTFCLSSIAFTQTRVKYWIGDMPANNSQTAKIKAVYTFRDSLWYVESRYLKGDSVFMTGSYRDIDKGIREGQFLIYHENGKLRAEQNYMVGQLHGVQKTWNEKGQLTSSYNYNNGIMVGQGSTWDDNGILLSHFALDETGTGEGKQYSGKDTLLARGMLDHGKKEGTWTHYDSAGNKSWEVIYKADTLTSSQCFNADGSKGDSCVFEREAQASGGLRAWKTYMFTSLTRKNYPSMNTMKKSKDFLNGTVYVRFVVLQDGSISNVEVLTPLNPEADEIAKSVIENGPLWVPAVLKNKPVKSYINQPITFRYEE